MGEIKPFAERYTEMREKHAALDVTLPERHPYTGEPFTEARIEIDNHMQQVERIAPPLKPPQEWEEGCTCGGCPCCGDCSCETTTVRLSDEEYAERLKQWQAAVNEFHRTGGVYYLRGEVTVSGEFKTTSGSTCEGRTCPGWEAWQWISETSRAPAGEGVLDGYLTNPSSEATGPAKGTG